jgi:hypothetical protein
MAETQARRTAAEARMVPGPQRQRLSLKEITQRLTAMHDVIGSLATADPADKATMYAQAGLSMTYHPATGRVDVEARPLSGMSVIRCPRGICTQKPLCAVW